MVEKGLRTKGGQPPAWSRMHSILTNKFYLGTIVWNEIEYPGNHQPLVSQELFERVQAVLNGHGKSEVRHRVHEHYLRGSLFCASCDSRLSDSFAQAKNYRYFFCLGRHTRRQDCHEPYTAASDLEQQVEVLWWRVELPQWVKDRIRGDARQEVQQRIGASAVASPRRSAGLTSCRRKEKDSSRLT
jgi:site-specific DNA recombinase